jgi:hypothetical protein
MRLSVKGVETLDYQPPADRRRHKNKEDKKEKMKNNNEEEGQTKLVPVNEPIGEIELPTIDVRQYVGKRVKISDVGTFKGEFGYCVKVQTEIVETIRTAKKDIPLRGSRIFGLQEDDQGNIGWGAETKLGVFLKKMKAKVPKDLIGKEVILQVKTAKSGTEFLEFG